jgi:hypothetical protein
MPGCFEWMELWALFHSPDEGFDQVIGGLDMILFTAHTFYGLSAEFEKLQHQTFIGDEGLMRDSVKEQLRRTLGAIEKLCEDINFVFSVRQIGRIKSKISSEKYTMKNFRSDMKILQDRIFDEMSSPLFVCIPADRADYYRNADLFGSDVSKHFPSASIDIDEAGKCLATGRNTACVFHLMRIMECGLRVLGKSLNDPNLDPKKNPTWDRILQRCDKELQVPYNQRTQDWQTHQQFFAEATANLRAVKDAWRNPALHIERFYDEEKALDIWRAVKAFMRHLATVLSE